MKDRLVIGEVLELRPFRAPVAGADFDAVEAREDVELRHDERGHRVQACRVAERDEVQPAGSARASRGSAELASSFADRLAHFVVELAREGTGPDAGSVGLGDAPHLLYRLATNPAPNPGSPGERIPGAHQRLPAMS